MYINIVSAYESNLIVAVEITNDNAVLRSNVVTIIYSYVYFKFHRTIGKLNIITLR